MDENTLVEVEITFTCDRSRDAIRHKIALELEQLRGIYSEYINDVSLPMLIGDIYEGPFSFTLLEINTFKGRIYIKEGKLTLKGILPAKYKKSVILTIETYLKAMFHVKK